MQLVKLITPKRINVLAVVFGLLALLVPGLHNTAFSQDNSPYSRYGIGDIVPSTHAANRALGGLAAGFSDANGIMINFSNPASYSNFQAVRELKSKKIVSGRAILDVGINFENRALLQGNPTEKFLASNALFSYVQIGVPLKPNWGFSFGLRPVSRISYKISQTERLVDPSTGTPIDSAITQSEGDGGLYLVSAGTGFKIKSLSLGFNVGYMFGRKDYKTKRAFINDTVDYLQANYETRSNLGNLVVDLGAQYKFKLSKNVSMTLGAYGNVQQKVRATKEIIRETFYPDANAGTTRLDSVSVQSNIKGNMIYPASYTAGFVVEKAQSLKDGSWLFGVDFNSQKWNNYRFYGQQDSVKNSWTVHVGAQLHPAPKRNYWSNVFYRFGFVTGPDYIRFKNKLPSYGVTFGLGLPIANYNRLSPGQATVINLSVEYGKRGNSSNVMRENLFRLTLGFSLSDFWFIKRKYE
jgi:hypothetical protein